MIIKRDPAPGKGNILITLSGPHAEILRKALDEFYLDNPELKQAPVFQHIEQAWAARTETNRDGIDLITLSMSPRGAQVVILAKYLAAHDVGDVELRRVLLDSGSLEATALLRPGTAEIPDDYACVSIRVNNGPWDGGQPEGLPDVINEIVQYGPADAGALEAHAAPIIDAYREKTGFDIDAYAL